MSNINRTRRWIAVFVKELECVICRSKSNRRLYWLEDRSEVDASVDSLEHIQLGVADMEVVCNRCVNRHIVPYNSGGRLQHKMEAAIIASLELRADVDRMFRRKSRR